MYESIIIIRNLGECRTLNGVCFVYDSSAMEIMRFYVRNNNVQEEAQRLELRPPMAPKW